MLRVATAAAALQMKAEFVPHVMLMALDLLDMDGKALVACLARQGIAASSPCPAAARLEVQAHWPAERTTT